MVEPTRKGALLDLVIMKNKELVRDMKVQESLGYSDCERMEFRILRRGSRGEKQDYSTAFQENSLHSLQSSAWKNLMDYDLEEKRGLGELADSQ